MNRCKYCGEPLPYKRRDDSAYCNHPSCRSKYHQEIGRDYRGTVTHHLIHEEKPWIHPHTCEQCGVGFDVNDYAERGGKRVPKFCSQKCKQKKYRDDQKQKLADAGKGVWQCRDCLQKTFSKGKTCDFCGKNNFRFHKG